MIYLEASVVLARVAQPRSPPDRFWAGRFTSSRLLEYEVWNRVHARRPATAYYENARELVARVDLIGLATHVLARALEPFPTPARTLDETASCDPGVSAGADDRLVAAARALGIPPTRL